jgi:hypothetical protein
MTPEFQWRPSLSIAYGTAAGERARRTGLDNTKNHRSSPEKKRDRLPGEPDLEALLKADSQSEFKLPRSTQRIGS